MSCSRKFFSAVILLSFCVLHGETWNAANKFAGWRADGNAVCTIQPDFIRLTEIQKDSRILCTGLNLDPEKYDTFRYRYRAVNIQATEGQLYYCNEHNTFSELRKWQLPKMIADGQWHTVTVPASRLENRDSWFKGGTVTCLRFDPTDGAGGEIEISEIAFLKTENPGPAASSQPSVSWSGKDGFAGWVPEKSMTVVPGTDSVRLLITGDDCQLVNRKAVIDPMKYNAVTFTYRAKGTSKRTGQFYFGNAKHPVTAASCWNIPALQDDGEWHTITLTEKHLESPDLWFKAGPVTILRFDPTDGKGGEIELKEIRFLPGSPSKPLPEKQVSSGVPPWPRLKPEFLPPVKPEIRGAYFKAKMISSPDDLQGKGKYTRFFFRKTFELKETPSSAWIQFIADDSADVYVNGHRIASNSSWRRTVTEYAGSYLRKGSNCLGFCCTNAGNVGGVFGELYVEYPDGSSERINTDSSFRTSVTAPSGWCDPAFAASDWKTVNVHPGPPYAPWTAMLEYRDFSCSEKLLAGTISSCRAGEKAKLSFQFEGNIPSFPLPAEIKLEADGKLLWEEEITLQSSMVRKGEGKRWDLAFDYELPCYLSGRKHVTLRLATRSFVTRSGGNPQVIFDFEELGRDPEYPAPPVVGIRDPGTGSPAFIINGKPTAVLWGSSASGAVTGTGSRAPYNVITVGPHSREWWPSPGVFDPVSFDRAAETARRRHPDAWFVWDLTFWIPKAWPKLYPKDICLDETGEDVGQQYIGDIAFSYSSKNALRDMLVILEKAIAYLERSPYRNRIIGYRINGGHTIEWLGWSPKGGRSVDFSEASRKGFAEFAKGKELENPHVPTHKQLAETENGRLLRDPAKHRNETLYMDYLSNTVAGYMLAMTARAKELLHGKKLVGTYYGYTMTLNKDGQSQHRGHYALKRVLDAGTADYLLSPPSYLIRNLGDASVEMKPFASLHNHGILSILEDDTRTHHGISGCGYNQTVTEEGTLNVLRRSMGFALCRQEPAFFIPLADRRMLDFSSLHRDFALYRTAAQFGLDRKTSRHAEIAIVTSEESIKAMPLLTASRLTGETEQNYRADGTVMQHKTGGTILCSEVYGRILNRFAQLGAPADYLLAEDLKDHPGQYKLYVFVNVLSYDNAMLEAVRKLRERPGTTLCWLYAPGWIHQNTGSTENMRKLTGLTLKETKEPLAPAVRMADGRWMGLTSARVTPLFCSTDPEARIIGRYEDGSAGLVSVRTGKAETVFYGGWQFDMPFLNRLAKHAGIHLYSETGDPLEANDRFLVLHARTPGEKTIRLNGKTDVLDVFNRKIVARNTDTFSFHAPLHSSRLLYCGEDAEKLLELLNKQSVR